jgi:hypothetical protein
MMPDFYTRPQLYRSGERQIDGPSISAVLGAKGNPNAKIFVCRAMPSSARGRFNLGDWVSTSIAYAKREGESIDGDVVIGAQFVRAGDLWTEGNSINEWGYWPMCYQCTNINRDTERCPNYGTDTSGAWLCVNCCKACC